DNRWKSSRQLVGALINAVSKGGNLLLNVGPDGRGNIPERSVQTLAEMGEWMHRNGKAIYGAGAAPMPKPEWGRLTRRGNTWFAHVTDPGIGHLKLPGLWSKFKSARVLFDGAAAGAANSHWGNNMGDMLLLNVGSPTYKTYEMPDPLVTVFSIELTGPPQISAESSH
ncbi:MAG: alpha-L-fucosidase, partial [Deltaproteobacteria bacterium]|nr:alpha-L-fucosidase [Deltaproteobacteria bacterium]